MTGFMGAGKSTIGSLLASAMNWKFIDMDLLIEKQQQCSIFEIFRLQGEGCFRKIESRILHTIAQSTEAVVATGGGVLLRARNRELMKKTGVQVWLQWEFDNLVRNVMKNPSARPLYTDENSFRNLFNKRQKGYAGADTVIKCDNKSPEIIVNEILQYMSISTTI